MNNSNRFKTQYSNTDSYKTYLLMFVFQVVVIVVFYIFVPLIAFAFGSNIQDFSNSANYIYVTCLVSPMVFALLFFWQNRRKQYTTRSILGLDKKVNIKYILWAIFIGISCVVFFSSISNLFDHLLEIIGFNPDDNINVRTDNIGFLFLNIFMLGCLPAVFEDLVFRGIIFNGFKSENSTKFAIIMSSILFALMHGSLQQTFYQLIIGLVLALVMHFTENIIYPIITHFTNNAIIIITHFFTTRAGIDFNQDWTFTSIFISILLAVLGVIFFYVMFKYITNKSNNNGNITKKLNKYSFEEKFYALAGLLIAVLSWITTTIDMWG